MISDKLKDHESLIMLFLLLELCTKNSKKSYSLSSVCIFSASVSRIFVKSKMLSISVLEVRWSEVADDVEKSVGRRISLPRPLNNSITWKYSQDF